MPAEIWTKCLFSSQHGSCPERPASGLHSLRWNVVAAWLPNQSPSVSAAPQSPCLAGWLLFSLAAKCCLHMFIHVATGCFIHQDGTYHSWIMKKKKKRSLAATLEINEWSGLMHLKESNISGQKRETSTSDMFNDEEWLWSTLLLKHNKAAALSTFFSFRRPLIGSVELQNWVYSS